MMSNQNKIDPAQLRQCFGSFMTGITVVTTMDDDTPIGFTANSFTSVSLDPALLLICIDNASDNLEKFTKAGHFGVNILADDQDDLSGRFASSVENRFSELNWQKTDIGNPELPGCAAFFDCNLETSHVAGDHTILIGRVMACHDTGKDGLGYHRGGYFTLDRK